MNFFPPTAGLNTLDCGRTENAFSYGHLHCLFFQGRLLNTVYRRVRTLTKEKPYGSKSSETSLKRLWYSLKKKKKLNVLETVNNKKLAL